MNSKKSIFSIKLMMEGFRQCKMIGILSLIIMVLGAVLMPAGIAISSSDSSVNVAEAVEAWSINPILVLVIPAVALMTLVLFHFLDTRSASDLYHALPHKRITLYLSYASSIVLWALILLFASAFCSVITCLITSKYIALIMSTVLPYLFSLFLISILIIGGMLIAINLSGTVFTNIVVSGMILFLPRVCFMILQFTIFDNIPILSSGISNNVIFSDDSNLLFGICSMIMGQNISADSIFRPEWHSIIYTFILAVIYLVIGALVFCRRSSESAGQSAPTRMHQHVYRIIITMAYCIIVTGALVSAIGNKDSSISSEDIFIFGILYLIGAFIYFVYELITTKKWHNLISALPGLALVAGLNLGLAVGLISIRDYIVDQRPKADEIKSISFGVNSYGLSMTTYWDYNLYVNMKNAEIEITDPDIISIISYYLDENVMTWKSEGANSYYNKYYHNNSKYDNYEVAINTGSKELNRIVMIPESDSNKILSIIENIPEYIETWKNPPKPVSMDTMYIESVNGDAFNSKTTEKIFNIYCQELKEISFKDLYEAFNNRYSNMNISYTFSENGYTKKINCPIYSDIMPKTAEAYFEVLYNEQAEDRNNFESLIKGGKYESIEVSLYGKDENGEDRDIISAMFDNTEESYSKLSKFIKEGPINSDDLYAAIWLYPYDYNNETISFVVPLDKNILKDNYFKENFPSMDTVYQ